MSLIEVSCKLSYEVIAPSSLLFNIAAARTAHQHVRCETLRVNPEGGYAFSVLGEKGYRILRIQAESGKLTLSYRATVALTPQKSDPLTVGESQHALLPVEVLPYLNPSRYCESDLLGLFALREFGELVPGFSRVTAICNWTYDYLDYVAGTTDARSGACDVLLQRTGVCRDYAHVAIALCRALGIPARYVSGYAVDLKPQDFHGFFEAYLGQQWYLFDATRMAPTLGLVRIGVGRDAADVSFATIVGSVNLINMAVSASEITNKIPDGMDGDEPAISTA